LELKAETVQKSESRLERLIEEQMVRLDPDKKRLMDNFAGDRAQRVLRGAGTLQEGL
jgi:hypothetical protein